MKKDSKGEPGATQKTVRKSSKFLKEVTVCVGNEDNKNDGRNEVLETEFPSGLICS